MGIIYRQAKMLLDAHRAGVPMNRLLMVGRQNLFLHPSELREVRSVYGGLLADYQWGEYADRFFKECLRVSEVSALDYSSYEGANLLYDLNKPVPGELEGQFDVVVEAGSLEHIFNVPVGIANLMKMTKVGGTIFACTISNNLSGHGFYQFSPELIFRVFTLENGFELGQVLALEARYPSIERTPILNAFEVSDPALVHSRVGLMTQYPVILLFSARKIAERPLFAKTPMQSDYAEAWTGKKTLGSRMPPWVRRIPLYTALRDWVAGQRQLREFSLKNERVFRKI